MKNTQIMDFIVDKENSKINVRREFAATAQRVWSAWTEPELLDQWWAPKPWKAETKRMEFKSGGFWLYAMVGPAGEKHWARADFKSVTTLKSFTAVDAFCDENGIPNKDMPMPGWRVAFEGQADSTFVEIEISFDRLADLEQYIALGFKEGFTAALENLDAAFSV